VTPIEVGQQWASASGVHIGVVRFDVDGWRVLVISALGHGEILTLTADEIRGHYRLSVPATA
jgi:hypothetical protein